MPTLFTRIIAGELPGRFVWKDPQVVAFLTIAPIKPGHVLVVPRQEIDHWLDVPPDLLNHLMGVAQTVGKAINTALSPTKVGLMLAGLEVLHCHVHLVPIDALHDLDFKRADANPLPEDLDAAAAAIRTALRAQGHGEVVDA